jgi:hypothetical protein
LWRRNGEHIGPKAPQGRLDAFPDILQISPLFTEEMVRTVRASSNPDGFARPTGHPEVRRSEAEG